MKSKILVICGPTASGKTVVSLNIAKNIPSELISFDSMQVYQEMPIVTQAPSSESGTHLVSFLNPSKEYSAAKFIEDAKCLIEKSFADGKTPVLVGGTGLYLRSLLYGLFESPGSTQADTEMIRKKYLEQERLHGIGHLHKQLQKIDEKAALKIHPNDTRRLIRALEVHESTGLPISELQPQRQGLSENYEARIFFLDWPRELLYERICKRSDMMMSLGLADEVRRLSKLPLSKTASMALGIREMNAYISGEKNLLDAFELLKKNTRNYAKRQVSWFRHEKNVEFISLKGSESSQDIASLILERWRRPMIDK